MEQLSPETAVLSSLIDNSSHLLQQHQNTERIEYASENKTNFTLMIQLWTMAFLDEVGPTRWLVMADEMM